MKTDPLEVELRINPALVEAILVRFIRSEITRTGFSRAVLGLSGGIDSTTVAYLASAINPIGDLYKTQLRQLAAHLGVPAAILAKAPSGDLWVGQTDEEELGLTYAEVDRLLVLLVDRRWQPAQLVRRGFDAQF